VAWQFWPLFLDYYWPVVEPLAGTRRTLGSVKPWLKTISVRSQGDGVDLLHFATFNIF